LIRRDLSRLWGRDLPYEKAVAMTDAPTAEIAQMSFETALRELETIVAQLERGEVELEQSIAMYERGAALKAHCEARLKEAQLKVEKIVVDADGAISAEPAELD
jgi:exodeoxyribonuclease VII small subunit